MRLPQAILRTLTAWWRARHCPARYETRLSCGNAGVTRCTRRRHGDPWHRDGRGTRWQDEITRETRP